MVMLHHQLWTNERAREAQKLCKRKSRAVPSTFFSHRTWEQAGNFYSPGHR